MFSCNSTQKDLSQDLSKNLNPTKETSVIKYDNEFINRIFDCEYRNLHFMWKNGKLVSMPFEKGIDTTYIERYADNTPDEVINKYNDMYLDQKNIGEDNERSMFSFISKEDREKYVVKIKMLRVLGNLDEDVFGVLSQLETNYYPKEYDYYKLRREYYNFYTAINFWGRRDIDGTFEKIGKLLNLLMDKLEID